MESTWVSVKEAARMLGLGERTVYRYVELGKLRSRQYVRGGRILVRRDDVEACRIEGVADEADVARHGSTST